MFIWKIIIYIRGVSRGSERQSQVKILNFVRTSAVVVSADDKINNFRLWHRLSLFCHDGGSWKFLKLHMIWLWRRLTPLIYIYVNCRNHSWILVYYQVFLKKNHSLSMLFIKENLSSWLDSTMCFLEYKGYSQQNSIRIELNSLQNCPNLAWICHVS